MLTVKHTNPDGCQTIYPAATVEFRPASYQPDGSTSPEDRDRVLAFNEAHYVVGEMFAGEVFVMNEQGQTVSRHDLQHP